MQKKFSASSTTSIILLFCSITGALYATTIPVENHPAYAERVATPPASSRNTSFGSIPKPDRIQKFDSRIGALPGSNPYRVFLVDKDTLINLAQFSLPELNTKNAGIGKGSHDQDNGFVVVGGHTAHKGEGSHGSMGAPGNAWGVTMPASQEPKKNIDFSGSVAVGGSAFEGAVGGAHSSMGSPGNVWGGNQSEAQELPEALVRLWPKNSVPVGGSSLETIGGEHRVPEEAGNMWGSQTERSGSSSPAIATSSSKDTNSDGLAGRTHSSMGSSGTVWGALPPQEAAAAPESHSLAQANSFGAGHNKERTHAGNVWGSHQGPESSEAIASQSATGAFAHQGGSVVVGGNSFGEGGGSHSAIGASGNVWNGKGEPGFSEQHLEEFASGSVVIGGNSVGEGKGAFSAIGRPGTVLGGVRETIDLAKIIEVVEAMPSGSSVMIGRSSFGGEGTQQPQETMMTAFGGPRVGAGENLAVAGGAGSKGMIFVRNDSALTITDVLGTVRPDLGFDLFLTGGSSAIFHVEKDLLVDTEIRGSQDANFESRKGGVIVKNGAGTVTLTSAQNDYIGQVDIQEGVLAVSHDQALGNTANPILLGQGTFQAKEDIAHAREYFVYGEGSISVDASKTLTLNGQISQEGSLTKSGPGTLVLNCSENDYRGGTTVAEGTLQASVDTLPGNVTNDATLVFHQDANATFHGMIDGSGVMIKQGEGTLVLTGANQYEGGTRVSSGTLQGNTETLPGNITNDAALVFMQENSGVFRGDIDGRGTLYKKGEGTLVLTGANSYTGGTEISSGTLQGNAEALVGNIRNDATLVFNQETTGTFEGNIEGNGTVYKVGKGTLTFTGANSYRGDTVVSAGMLRGNSDTLPGNIVNHAALAFDQEVDGVFAGIISGSGTFAKLGEGALTLTGENTFTGGATIFAGTLVGSSYTLPGHIANDAALVFDQKTSGVFAGVISGQGSVSKRGEGTLVLKGMNTYRGDTTIFAGALEADTDTLPGNVTNYGTLIFNQEKDGVFNGQLYGDGIFDKRGSGNLALGGSGTFIGKTLVSSGTLSVRADTLFGDIINNAELIFDQQSPGTFKGDIAGIGSLHKKGPAALTLEGSNRYTGETRIHEGVLRINVDSLSGDIINHGGLVFNQTTDGVYKGDISGTGSFDKQGEGSLTLMGLNHFEGDINVSQGSLQINDSGCPGDIFNQGHLVFNQETSGNLSGNISGNGIFDKQGSGHLIFTGSGVQSSYVIHSGKFSVQDSITGSVLVAAGGALGGNGKIMGDVTNFGLMAPGASIGTATIVGSYAQSAGSFLEVEINPTTADLLQVAGSPGTITIEPNTTLLIVPEKGRYSSGTIYTIATATGGVSGQFSHISSTLPTFKADVFYGSNDIRIGLLLLSLEEVVEEWNKKLARALDQATFVVSSGSDLHSIITALRLLDLGDLDDALEQMQSAPFKNVAIIQQQNSFDLVKSVENHMIERMDIPCRDPAQKGWSVWGQVMGDLSSQDKTSEQPGHHTVTGGAILGSDVVLAEDFLVGFGAAYTYSDIDFNFSRGDGNARSYYGLVYGSWNREHFFIDTALLGGWMDLHGTRRIHFSNIDRNATHSNQGGQVDAHLGLGFNYEVAKIQTRPFAGFDFHYLSEGNYNEQGAGSLDLHISDKHYKMIRTELGVNFSHCFVATSSKWIPEVQASWVREMRLEGKHYTAQLRGHDAVFTITGYYPDRSLLGLGASLRALFYGDVLSSTLTYSGEFAKNYYDQYLSLQVGYAF